ncbi:MAG: aminoacyl-tRNA hydrolase [Christensenellales bacterium]
MIVIVGLGNPGKNYDKTVHNMGYMAIDNFAKKHELTFNKSKYFASVAEGFIGGEKVVLLKPETFMNLSGKSVEEVVRMHKLDTKNVIVILDDIDLPFGDVRVRAKGSAGTHNGLRDIVSKIGEDFPRIRIGVGRPEYGDLVNFVLSRVPDEKLKILEDKFDKVSRVLDYFVERKTVEGIDITRI